MKIFDCTTFFNENLMLEINVNDILKNNVTNFVGEKVDSMNREIKIIYFEQF